MKECVNKKVSLPLFENNSMMLNGLFWWRYYTVNYFKNNFSNVTDGKLLEKIYRVNKNDETIIRRVSRIK